MVLDNFNKNQIEIIKALLELRRLSKNLNENPQTLERVQELIKLISNENNKVEIKNILDEYSKVSKNIPSYKKFENELSQVKLLILNLKLKPEEQIETKKKFSINPFKKKKTPLAEITIILLLISSIGTALVQEVRDVYQGQTSPEIIELLKQVEDLKK